MADTANRSIRNDAITRLVSNVDNNSDVKTFALEGEHYAKIVAVTSEIKAPLQYDTVYNELGDDNPYVYKRIYFAIGSTNISEPFSPDSCVALPPIFESVEKANISGREGAANYISPRATKLAPARAEFIHTANQHTCIVDMTKDPTWDPKAGDRIVVSFENVHRSGQVYMQEPVFQRLHERGYDNVPPTVGEKVSNAFNKMVNKVFTGTPPPPCDEAQAPPEPLPPILERIKAAGYQVCWRGDYHLQVFGIRSPTRNANAFDDQIGVAYTVDGAWKVEQWPATTTPGYHYLENPMNGAGTAILVPGQYKDVWKLGLHRGQYEALRQSGPVNLYRDNNKDVILDMDPSTIVETSTAGINIHRSTSKGTSTEVNRWSAGCQVHATSKGHARMVELANLQVSKTGIDTFTYTLLDA